MTALQSTLAVNATKFIFQNCTMIDEKSTRSSKVVEKPNQSIQTKSQRLIEAIFGNRGNKAHQI